MTKLSSEKLIQLLGKEISNPEIEKIHKDKDCEVTDISPIVYYALYPQGFSLEFGGGILNTIILYNSGVEDYTAFASALPKGLDFSMNREDGQKLLGKPSRSGTDTDIYEFSDYVLYAEYLGPNGALSSVTLMTPAKYAE